MEAAAKDRALRFLAGVQAALPDSDSRSGKSARARWGRTGIQSFELARWSYYPDLDSAQVETDCLGR